MHFDRLSEELLSNTHGKQVKDDKSSLSILKERLEKLEKDKEKKD